MAPTLPVENGISKEQRKGGRRKPEKEEGSSLQKQENEDNAAKTRRKKVAATAEDNKKESESDEQITDDNKNTVKIDKSVTEKESTDLEAKVVLMSSAVTENGQNDPKAVQRNTEEETKASEIKDVKKSQTLKRKSEKTEAGSVATQRKKVFHKSHGSVAGIALTLGQGTMGQLGLGVDIVERKKPAKVNIEEGILQVCAGGMHTACLSVSGQVYTFGCNDSSALGRVAEEEEESSVPGKVNFSEKIVQISAGDSHTAALTEDGRVFAWGSFRDGNGSIGLASSQVLSTPTEIFNEEPVVKISSGNDHIVCLTESGDIYTFGNAEQGQLGRVSAHFSVRGGRRGLDKVQKPGKVYVKHKRHIIKFSDAWAGQHVTFGKQRDTCEIYAWGLNNYYQLGLPDMEDRFVPELVVAFDKNNKWHDLSSGQHHTLALDQNGKVYALGRGDYGRLGFGEEAKGDVKVPTLINGLADKKCVQIACGTAVSYAVTEEGNVYAWGMGSNYQLGQTEEDDLFVPTLINGQQLQNRRVTMVSSGGQHTALLAVDNASSNAQ